ncbi:G/T mismatches repair enzyme [uncultured archaeon]|nr:G/T mismatches repair enzyme [uncultured archaeon]
MKKLQLVELYDTLKGRYGFLDWWPGETRLEIFIGAILTQNTSWSNVEKAIANLKAAGALDLHRLAHMRRGKLEALIRPSGFYRQKAERLASILRHIEDDYGSLETFLDMDGQALRSRLLEMKGIGSETADSIVLYAADKPSFVIDAYTKRIMHRVYGTREDIAYGDLQNLIVQRIPKKVRLYKDFHAQFVEHAKLHCRKAPSCKGCPVRTFCGYNG